jgi:hypothetical protein
MKKILLLNLLLIAWGCQSNEPQHPIVGDWRWVSSTGGIAGWTVKPRNNDEYVPRFTASGTFEVYTNTKLFYSGNYRLTNTESIYSNSKEPSFVVENFVRHEKDTVRFYPIFPKNGTIISRFSNKELELADNCYDCYGHYFLRK